MTFSFTNTNTVLIKQIDYKGADREFNYGLGKEFVPQNTNLMIATTMTGPAALSGTPYTYIGLSKVLTKAQLHTICTNSDADAVTKKLSKSSVKKQKKMMKAIKKNSQDTYAIGIQTFLSWLEDSGLNKTIASFFAPKIPDDSPFSIEEVQAIQTMSGLGFKEDGSINQDALAVNILCPTKLYEDITDAKLMFFINNNKHQTPEILGVVYSEKENYYALDDITFYDFAMLPNSITRVLHPDFVDQYDLFQQDLKKRLAGALVRVPSKKVKDNGQQIHIVTDVLEHNNGYVQVEAHHHDNQPIEVTYGGVKVHPNKYRWWVSLTDEVTNGNEITFISPPVHPMVKACVTSMRHEELLRMGTYILALTGSKGQTKSDGKNGHKSPSFTR